MRSKPGAAALPAMKRYPASLAQFSRKGHPYEAGDLLQQLDLPDARQDPRERGRVSVVAEFGSISRRELGELRGVVGIPAAQLRGRGHLLAPQRQGGALLGKSAWPQPVDEHALTGCGIGRVIDPGHPHR